MPRRPASFRKSDLERALRAAKAAGLQIARFEIDQAGKIVVFVGTHDTVVDTPLDRWMASRARTS